MRDGLVPRARQREKLRRRGEVGNTASFRGGEHFACSSRDSEVNKNACPPKFRFLELGTLSQKE
jgi:hypothetical protein